MDKEKQDLNQFIIDQYKQDEKMMVIIFSQWCINNNLNPVELYERAYPDQMGNDLLQSVQRETLPKEEADDIPLDIVMQVLHMFGNDDLAFIVQETAEKMKIK